MLQKSLYWLNVCLLLQSTSFLFWENTFEIDNSSLEEIVNRTPLLKFWCIVSFSSDFVATLPIRFCHYQHGAQQHARWALHNDSHVSLRNVFRRLSGSINQKLPVSSAEKQAIDFNKTTRASQCLRFLRILYSNSSFQNSIRGIIWEYWYYCTLFHKWLHLIVHLFIV